MCANFYKTLCAAFYKFLQSDECQTLPGAFVKELWRDYPAVAADPS